MLDISNRKNFKTLNVVGFFRFFVGTLHHFSIASQTGTVMYSILHYKKITCNFTWYNSVVSQMSNRVSRRLKANRGKRHISLRSFFIKKSDCVSVMKRDDSWSR